MTVLPRWLDSFEFFEEGYISSEIVPLLVSSLASQPSELGNDLLLIYSGSGRRPSQAAGRVLREQPRCGALVLSDEELKHRFKFHAFRRFVLRNYFQPRWSSKRVYTIPLGFNASLLGLREQRGNIAQDRPLAWSFVGEVKSDRALMLDVFSHVGPNRQVQTARFDDPDGLRGKDLFDVYSASHFVLCPFGNRSPDSFRVMEALEAGAIPVTISFLGTDHNRLVFGDHPFVVGRDWRHALKLVEELLANPAELQARHRQIILWYARFRQDLKADLVTIFLGGGRQQLRSRQFRFQLEASRDIGLRWKYLLHYSSGLRRVLRAPKRALDNFLVGLRLSRFLRS